MAEREIPTHFLDFDVIEGTDEFYFNCPITGENVVDMHEWPEELIMYFDNLDGIHHLNTWAEELNNQYEQLEEGHEYYELREYIQAHLPLDKEYYILEVTHPQGVHGDYIQLLYEGVYEGRVNNYPKNPITLQESYPDIPLIHIEDGFLHKGSEEVKLDKSTKILIDFKTPPKNLVIQYKNWDDNDYQSEYNNKPPFTYLVEGYSHTWSDYQKLIEESDESPYLNFIHYLIDTLPKDKPYFRILLSSSQGCTEDYDVFVYEGTYQD